MAGLSPDQRGTCLSKLVSAAYKRGLSENAPVLAEKLQIGSPSTSSSTSQFFFLVKQAIIGRYRVSNAVSFHLRFL